MRERDREEVENYLPSRRRVEDWTDMAAVVRAKPRYDSIPTIVDARASVARSHVIIGNQSY